MIADLSNMQPYILQIALAAVLIVGLLVGLFRGFIKTLFGLVAYVVYAVAISFFLTPAANFLKGFGFIESGIISSGFNNSSIYTSLESMMPTLINIAYQVIATVILLLLGFVVVRIVVWAFNKIIVSFKFTKKLNRIFGAILGFLLASVAATAMLTVVSCELLFTGGKTWIQNSPGVDGFNDVTSGLRVSLLCNNGITCDVDTLIAKTIGGSDMTKEDVQSYTETLGRVDDIINDPNAYASQAMNEDGTVNEEGLSNIINDAAVFSELADKLGGSAQLNQMAGNLIDNSLSQIPEDTTVELTQKDVDNLKTIQSNLDLTPAQAAELNDFINNQVVVKEE